MNVELGLRLALDLLECFGEFEPLQGQIRNQFCQILRFLPFYRVLLKWHLSRPHTHIQRPNSAKNQSLKFLPSEIRRRMVQIKNPHFHEILNSEFDFRFLTPKLQIKSSSRTCKPVNFYILKYVKMMNFFQKLYLLNLELLNAS